MEQPEPIDVLVIEDDADTRANLCDILELDQHRVSVAGSLAEARERAPWTEVSIILLDRKLPDGSAEDVLPELRQLAPQADIVIVTGFRDLEVALNCLHQGAADYILKPINPEMLRTNLQRIAQSRQVAQQLRLLDTAVREVKEGILITDGEQEWLESRIVFANAALMQSTGYQHDDLKGETPAIFHSPRTDALVVERMCSQLGRGEAFTGEIIQRRKDGSEYFAEVHVSPVFNRSGRVQNYVASHRDITARKLAEERTLQAQRLAAIGEMVTGLAHESRNALQRSMACLEMLALEVEDHPDALDLVMRVQRAQNYLQHLFEEVRGYAAPLNLRQTTTNMAEVWREAWSQLEELRGGREVTLREETGRIDLMATVDSFAMGQVFRNIFENSIVACPNPCEIVVKCMPLRLNGRPALQISVLDNGPGLTQTQLQKIFEPFFTTKTKGTGLGMAIAKRIVEAHGGRIAAVGGNKGAEILVIVPRQPASRSAEQADQPVASPDSLAHD